MRTTTVLSSVLGLSASVVHASPAVVPRAGTFSTTCTGLAIRDFWLVGDCATGYTSEPLRENSSIWLGTRITNNQGTLEWKNTGDGNFQRSCTDCSILAGTGTLSCTCDKKATTLNLEDHILNVLGQLRYNFGEFPAAPLPSSLDVPADFHIKTGLGTTDQCADSSGIGWEPFNPVSCFTLSITSTGPTAMKSIRIDSNPGYKLDYFTSKDCSGTALGSVLPSTALGCTQFSSEVYSLKLTPQWNADW